MSPVEILDRVGEVAYRLALHPPSKIHNVLHVSMFKKYVADPSHGGVWTIETS